MVIVKVGYAGLNITSKLAMDSGMKPLVLVAYRQIFATLAIIAFAYFFEWAIGNQILFLVGLRNSTPTIGSALTNIQPAVTFVLPVIFRQECVGIKKKSGQAKVIGTIMCVGGAMLLSFYHGYTIGIPDSSIHWKYAEQIGKENASSKSNLILGSILPLASSVSSAAWIIIQTRMSKNFPATYTSTTLMCFLGSIECGAIGLLANHRLSAWSLRSPIRLISAIYAGVVCSALAYSLTYWSIQRKGPLYVSVFSPLMLVIVAIVSWGVLREKLFVGTALGSVLMVAGLYAVLLGRDKEIKPQNAIQETEATKQVESGDLELQMHTSSKGNCHAAG